MKLDNFTTARCNKCHWTKQFKPGKEYDFTEFKCNCEEVVKAVEKKAGRPPNSKKKKGV